MRQERINKIDLAIAEARRFILKAMAMMLLTYIDNGNFDDRIKKGGK